MSSFLVRAHARMFWASSMLVAKIVAAMPNWKFACFCGERLHGLDRLAGLVEAALHVADLIVDVADAVERDAGADQQIVRRRRTSTIFVSIGIGPVRRQAGGVDADLAHPRQVPLEHLDHLRQIVARGRFAARDVQVLDRAPERMAHRRLELRERHVRLAIAVLPVVAHLAVGVAHPGAVVDEHGRPDRLELRHHQRVGEVARHAGGSPREIAERESAFGHADIVQRPPRRW